MKMAVSNCRIECNPVISQVLPNLLHGLAEKYLHWVGKGEISHWTTSYPLWITLNYVINWRSSCELLGSIFFFHLPRQTIPLRSDPVSFQSCNINRTLKISSLMFILTNWAIKVIQKPRAPLTFPCQCINEGWKNEQEWVIYKKSSIVCIPQA